MSIDSAMGPLFFRSELPKKIIHVGANSGQEYDYYSRVDGVKVVYVEPLDDAFRALSQRLSQAGRPEDHIPVQALCLAEVGRRIALNISNHQGVASSVLGLGRVKMLHPEVEYVGSQEFVSTTVDRLTEQTVRGFAPDLMVIDTQGAELEVLKGAERNLRGNIRYVFCEVSDQPLYEGGASFEDISAFLSGFDFKCVFMLLNAKGWGDALFVREEGAA